jgi:hypothetical protein
VNILIFVGIFATGVFQLFAVIAFTTNSRPIILAFNQFVKVTKNWNNSKGKMHILLL